MLTGNDIHNSKLFGYINLDDVGGLQEALVKLGYAPGKLDGIAAPNTKDAIKVFQGAASLPVDAIAGPKTKSALLAMLEKSAAAGDAGA